MPEILVLIIRFFCAACVMLIGSPAGRILVALVVIAALCP